MILFLAHQKGISEVLPWDKKSYLTQAVMQRLYIGCIGTHSYGLQVTYCYVKMTSSCHFASQCIQELLGAFFKNENAVFNGEQAKNPLFV